MDGKEVSGFPFRGALKYRLHDLGDDLSLKSGELRLETVVIAGSLLSISALAWILSAQPMMMGVMGGMLGLDLTMLVLFAVSWTLGMVAMMFPTVLPMTLMVFRAGRSSSREIKVGGGPTLTKAFTFAGAYLSLWAGFGVVLYLGIMMFSSMGGPELLGGYASLAPPAIVLAAGVYQFVPLKGACLGRCHPSTFLFRRYRGGFTGSARMGYSYGLFCVGCCWVLMVNLLVIGAMNLTWMGLFAAGILVERVAPQRWRVSKVIGTVLIIVGILMLVPLVSRQA